MIREGTPDRGRRSGGETIIARTASDRTSIANPNLKPKPDPRGGELIALSRARLNFDSPVLIVVVTAAKYPEVETALKAKEDGNPAPTYRLIRESLRSADQRAKARRRKGTKSPLHRAVQRMLPDLPSRTFENLLNVFRNEDAMLDLYESLSNPIDIQIQEVLENAQRIDYGETRMPECGRQPEGGGAP